MHFERAESIHAQSVRFVTGHSRQGELPDTVDWKGLTDPATTTVFYMGARMAGRIRDRLIGEGMSSGTPAVVVTNVSRPDERHWTGSLADLEAGVDALAQGGPVLIGIGRTFSNRAIAATEIRQTG